MRLFQATRQGVSEVELKDTPKSLEEAFFNVADRIKWQASAGFYNSLTNPSTSSNFPTMTLMKQPNMSLKLGRFAQQPLLLCCR